MIRQIIMYILLSHCLSASVAFGEQYIQVLIWDDILVSWLKI